MSQIARVSSIGGRRLSNLTRGLLILFAINGVLINIVFRATGWDNTALRYARTYALYPTGATEIVGTDSWYPMIEAIEHVRENPEVPLYSTVFFDESTKFQYPPTSLLLLEPVQALSRLWSVQTLVILNHFSWACVLLVGVFTSMLFYKRTLIQFRSELSDPPISKRIALYCGILLLTFSFYPIARSFFLGQIQTQITLLATAALLAWHYERKKTAGLLIGLICTMKPHWGAILLWAWLRKQWGAALAGTLAAIAMAGISVSVYGLHHHMDYLSVLSSLSRHGEAYYPNQSMNGLMHRLLCNGDNLKFQSDGFPPFHPVVYGATLISTIVILGAALIWKCRKVSGSGINEFAMIMVSTTMASPIAWEHHYGILLPVFAIVTPVALSRRVFGKWTIPYLVIAFFLASQRLGIVYGFGHTPLNILQSHVFFSGIMVLTMLYVISHRPTSLAQESWCIEEVSQATPFFSPKGRVESSA